MKLNKNLPHWVFIATMIAAIFVIILVVIQAKIALKDIRQTGLSIAEIGKDYCGAAKHQQLRESGEI